jgi:hypothetical protein
MASNAHSSDVDHGNGNSESEVSNAPAKPPKKKSYDVHPRYKPRVLLHFPKKLPDGVDALILQEVLRENGERTVAIVSPEESLETRIEQGFRRRADALITNTVSNQAAQALFSRYPYAAFVLLTDENPDTAFGDFNYEPSRDTQNIGFLEWEEELRAQTGELPIQPDSAEPFVVQEVTKFLAATYSPTTAAVSSRRFSEFLDRVLGIADERQRKITTGELDRYYMAASYATSKFLEVETDVARERAYAFTRELYNKLFPQAGHPKTFLFRRNTFQTTEKGFLRVGFADEQRGLKEMPADNALVVKADSDFFTKHHQEAFPIERIYAALTSTKSIRGYAWKEVIQGPTLYGLLEVASGLVDHTKRSQPYTKKLKEYMDFPNACLDIAAQRIKVWEQHAPEVPKRKDPAAVAKTYKKNIVLGVENAAVRLQIDLTQAELQILEQGIYALGYDAFTTKETLVRRCDPSFLNMIFRLEDDELANLTVDDENEIIVNQQTLDYVIGVIRTGRGGIQRKKLLDRVVHVDTPARYGVVIENLMEVLETRETGLGEKAIKRYINRCIKEYKGLGEELIVASVEAMGFYRAMRKVFFNCALFGPDMHFSFKDKDALETPEYKAADERIQRNIEHYFNRATYWLNERIKCQGKEIDKYARTTKNHAWNTAIKQALERKNDSTTTYDVTISAIVSAESEKASESSDHDLAYGFFVENYEQLHLFESMVNILSRFTKPITNIDYEALSVVRTAE